MNAGKTVPCHSHDQNALLAETRSPPVGEILAGWGLSGVLFLLLALL